jgi:EmrB/QacA subfamily drug resistance transporter
MTARGVIRLALLGLGSAVVPLDTAVNIAFPDITGHFHLPIAMIQWVVIAYVLTYASLLLAFGRIGDIFGHARVFRAGLLWCAVAFLLCGVAPSYGWLLFFRFLQGIGAGLVISCAPALVTSLYAEERRGRALGAFTMMFAIGSAVGPLLGGVLVALWGWPAVFWFRAPLALFALLALKGLPEAPIRVAETLDVPGAFLLALGLGTLLFLLNERQLLWALPLLALALLSLCGFVFWESRVSRPIVDLDLFRNFRFLVLNLASAAVNLAAFSVLLFVPYYLVRLTRLPLPVAGAVLAASFLGMILSSPLAGVLVERIAAHRLAALGAGLGGAGLFLIGSLKPSLAFEWLALLVSLLVQGAGLGLFQVAYMEVVMATLPRGDRGVAGGLSMLTRTVGILLGATLLSLLFHGFESASTGDRAAGFLAAFGATFRIAGLVSAAVAVLALFRGPENPNRMQRGRGGDLR